jgi:cell division protein FtsB
MSIRKQIFNILPILVGILLIISLSRDLQQLLEARERIEKEQEEVEFLEAEQQELAQELEYVMSDEFVEKEAREKLLMSRPGETVILLPSEGENETDQDNDQDDEKRLANWEKWIQLFL